MFNPVFVLVNAIAVKIPISITTIINSIIEKPDELEQFLECNVFSMAKLSIQPKEYGLKYYK